MTDGKTRILDARCFGHRFRVLVERDEVALRRQPCQDFPAVAAAPEGRVDVRAGAVRSVGKEGFHRFFQQDGRMGPRLLHFGPQNEKSWNTSGICPWVASA